MLRALKREIGIASRALKQEIERLLRALKREIEIASRAGRTPAARNDSALPRATWEGRGCFGTEKNTSIYLKGIKEDCFARRKNTGGSQ